jgi:hypothetical protein
MGLSRLDSCRLPSLPRQQILALPGFLLAPPLYHYWCFVVSGVLTGLRFSFLVFIVGDSLDSIFPIFRLLDLPSDPCWVLVYTSSFLPYLPSPLLFSLLALLSTSLLDLSMGFS